MPRFAASVIAIVALCAVAISCTSDSSYITCLIETIPSQPWLERQITVYRTAGRDSGATRIALRLPELEADRLERTYGVRPDSYQVASDTAVTYMARRRFATIPNDIGNWGMLRQFDSSLGQAWIYIERFGGNPDPMADLEGSLGSVDEVVDMLVGWTEAELGKAPGWPALRYYFKHDLRRVLQNYALRTWRSDSTDSEASLVSLLEHPAFLGLISIAYQEDEWDFLPTLRRMALSDSRKAIAEILGLRTREESDDILHFLSHPDTAYQSLSRYVAGEIGEPPETALAKWTESLEESSKIASFSESSWNSGELVVQLAVQPGHVGLETNGAWEPELQRVVWSRSAQALKGRSDAPFVCQATWALPDSSFQRRLFGDAILSGWELIAYSMWFSALDTAHQNEWGRMLKRLRPGRLGPLKRFKFSDKRVEEDGDEIYGKKLLREALDGG